MSCPTCDHLMEDGVFCGSPALRDQRYCYFHLNARARRVQTARDRLRFNSCRLQMPILDNMHAVQAGLQQVVDALADDRIETRRAGQLLYALQQAAANLNHTIGWDSRVPALEAGEPLRALEVRDLQEQYDLPFDTDLEAPSDVAAAEIEAKAALPLEARKKPVRPALARVPAHGDAWNDDDDDHEQNGDEPGYDQLTYDDLRRELQAAKQMLTRPAPAPSQSTANPADAA